VEATYELVHEQLREGLESLKNECRDATKQQEALIRSDMDQIINSQTFLETKLQGMDRQSILRICPTYSVHFPSILCSFTLPFKIEGSFMYEEFRCKSL